LWQLRLAAGLTQEALAERAGVSAKAISGLERDPNRTPRLDTVALLADALGLDPTQRAQFLASARPNSVVPPTPADLSAQLPHPPRPLTQLIGRDAVVGVVAGMVRRGQYQLITLTGPGGVGKTRLAIAVANRVADDFAEGTAFVDLAPLRDPDLVLPTIAQCLGVDEHEAEPLASRLAASLHGKRFLLLLDNFEHLVEARDALLSLLESCPRLVVLATSRTALRVRGEREYRVAPLDLPADDIPPEELAQSAAATLFLERARAVGIAVEPDAATAAVVAAICRRLDGLPLAIELAASWARLLPLPALLARLERSLPLLVDGSHDLPARQRTMRDAIAWSYDLLDAPEQKLFRQLAIFVGGCTVEAAEAIASDPTSADDKASTAALSQLAILADRSLLRRDDDGDTAPRLTLLETIREYGLEQLVAHDEVEAASERHAAYYLALAEAADAALSGPEGLGRRASLAREHDNLRAAIGWLLKRGDGVRALRLAGAMARFWSERGYLSEGRRWLREAMTATAGLDEEIAESRGTALVGAAMLAIDQAAYDEAARFCGQAVVLARESTSGPQLVAALNARGLLARAQGRYGDAARDHDEAHALAERMGDRAGAAAALNGLATAAGFTGDARASALAEQSVVAFRELGDARGLAEALLGVMWRAANASDYARVEALGEEVLTLFRALGDTGRIAETLFVLGITAQFQGRHVRATALHEEGLALRRRRGDERGAVEQLAALAAIALQLGNRDRARSLLDETLVILQQYDDPWNRAMSLVLLAQVNLADGETEDARALLVESAAIYRAIGNLLYVPWCLEGLAGVAAAQGEWKRAARLCGAREALCARLGSPISPCHPEGYASTLASIQTALGDVAFAATYAEGEAIPVEVVLADAATTSHDGERQK
jgi:predicted ATPase/transcriptional regulator with XRE-family HTH domain